MAIYNPSSNWRDTMNNIKPVNLANIKPYEFPKYNSPTRTSTPQNTNAYDKAMSQKDIYTGDYIAKNNNAISNGGAYAGSSSGGGYISNPFGDLLSQMQERENQRYAQNKSYIENAFNSLLGNIRAGYDSGVDTVNKNADKAQQEAYINNMKAQRDLPQNLSALGITGGASESTAASMQNSYGQSRNATDNSRAEAIAQLLQQLNTATSNLDAEKSNQLMNVYNSNTDNLNAIAENFAAKQADYATKQFSARNAATSASIKQAENAAKAKTEAMQNNPYYKYAQNAIAEGKPISEVETNLLEYGFAPTDVHNFIKGFSPFGG